MRRFTKADRDPGNSAHSEETTDDFFEDRSGIGTDERLNSRLAHVACQLRMKAAIAGRQGELRAENCGAHQHAGAEGRKAHHHLPCVGTPRQLAGLTGSHDADRDHDESDRGTTKKASQIARVELWDERRTEEQPRDQASKNGRARARASDRWIERSVGHYFRGWPPSAAASAAARRFRARRYGESHSAVREIWASATRMIS